MEKKISSEEFLVKIKTNSKKPKIEFDERNNQYLVHVKARPIDNKANEELVKVFKKLENMKVKIVSGHTSKIKKLKRI